MGESSSYLPVEKNDDVPEIPIEIISDEEMAHSFTFSAVPTTPSSTTLPLQLHKNAKFPIQSFMVLSNRAIANCSQSDIEDFGNIMTTQKRRRVAKSYLHRFRKNRGLSVTDLMSTVIKRVAVKIKSREDF